MEFLTTKEYNRGADETKAGPPSGLCRQGEAILLTDECNHRLECYFPLENRSTFFGKRGSGEGEFYYPKGVQVDRRGNIYVADCWNHRIQKFSTDWDFLLSFGKYGAGPAEFNEPYAIEIGPDDLLYVVDRCNHRIQVFTTTGKFKGSVGKRGTTLEGELAELYGTPENLFKKPSFEFPNDIAFDSSSNLFVVDSNNHRVVRLDKQGRFVFSFGTKGTGPGELKFPYGISIDQNDLLFVSDMNNERIQVFTPEGVVVGSFQECAQGKLTCPTTLNVTSSGELFFTTGFSSSLFKTGYSPVTPSELYSVDARKKKGELQVAFFQYEKESVEAAFEHFITFLKACDPSALLAAICENPDHIDFFFEKIQPTDLVKEKNFDAIAGLFERTFLKQKNRVNTQFIKRAELNRELFMSQQDREREILQGKDTYNTRFVTLEREDRELFRELRREMLTLKKVLSFQGSLLWKVFRHEPMSTETKDEVIVKTAEHIYSLIAFTLEMLTEREEIHARRETSFKDDKGNREENLSNFRFFTLLFDTLESFTQILLDLLRDHLKEALLNFSFFPPEKIGLFRSTAERCSGEGAFKDLVSKIFILTVDDPVPYYASIQKTLKEFTYTLYNSDVRIDFKNPFGVDRKEEILTQVFHLMVLEHTFLDLKKDFGFTIDPEIRKIHEGSFETLKNSISRTFEESERLASESALLDVQVNKTIVRDEKLRITMTNKLRLLSFAENLNFRTLGSLFLIQRINLLALTGIGEKGKRLDFINSLLGKSYESFFFLGKGEAEGDVGKRRGLLELKVNSLKQLVKKNFLDVSSIYRYDSDDFSGSPESKIPLRGSFSGRGNSCFPLVNPIDICEESGGSLLVADSGSNSVVQITKSGEFVTKWSGNKSFDGEFFHPFGISVDSKGDVYVSDAYKHRIQKFKSDGTLIGVFGKKGSNDGDFNLPGRIAIDKNDDVFVSDQLNSRVQKFDREGNHLLSFGKKGVGGEGAFSRPGGIFCTSGGELLVGDYSGSKVQLFNGDGGFISDFSQMSGREPSCVVGISQTDDKTICLSDFWNGTITFLKTNGERLGSLGGEGVGEHEFLGLAASLVVENRMYCCDFFSGRVKVFNFDLACFM